MAKRKINVSKLDDSQLETAIHKISEQINSEVDATCDKVNKLLSRYGLKCKMQIAIEELNASEIAEEHDKIKQETSTL
jgi:hypothetical protein